MMDLLEQLYYFELDTSSNMGVQMPQANVTRTWSKANVKIGEEELIVIKFSPVDPRIEWFYRGEMQTSLDLPFNEELKRLFSAAFVDIRVYAAARGKGGSLSFV